MTKHRPLWIGLAALVLLPFVMRALGLSTNTASQIVCLAIAALGLNMLVGFTGLTSFGQKRLVRHRRLRRCDLPEALVRRAARGPILFSIAFVAVLSCLVGLLILRRRGVYFALLTLAFAALTYAVAFRLDRAHGRGGRARRPFSRRLLAGPASTTATSTTPSWPWSRSAFCTRCCA